MVYWVEKRGERRESGGEEVGLMVFLKEKKKLGRGTAVGRRAVVVVRAFCPFKWGWD